MTILGKILSLNSTAFDLCTLEVQKRGFFNSKFRKFMKFLHFDNAAFDLLTLKAKKVDFKN